MVLIEDICQTLLMLETAVNSGHQDASAECIDFLFNTKNKLYYLNVIPSKTLLSMRLSLYIPQETNWSYVICWVHVWFVFINLVRCSVIVK